MSSKDKDSPAFPGWTQNHYTDQRPVGGMSVRDYFAAHAPTPPDTWRPGDIRSAAAIAEWAWQYADAMLKARVA